jgi:hypothetical protein
VFNSVAVEMSCLCSEYCGWRLQILGVLFPGPPLLDHPKKDIVPSRARMKKLIIV